MLYLLFLVVISLSVMNLNYQSNMYYLHNICFLCLNCDKNNTSQDHYSEVQEKLEYILPSQILSISNIPKHVCAECMKSLKMFCKFRRKCIDSVIIFNKYVQKLAQESGSYKYLSVKLSDVSYLNNSKISNEKETSKKTNEESNCSASIINKEIFESFFKTGDCLSQTKNFTESSDCASSTDDSIEADLCTLSADKVKDRKNSSGATYSVQKEHSHIKKDKLFNQEHIPKCITDTTKTDSIFECKSCKLVFTTVEELENHTFRCKEKNKPDEMFHVGYLIEIDTYKTVEIQPRKDNIEQTPIQIEDTLEKFQVKQEINEESITYEKPHIKDDIFECGTSELAFGKEIQSIDHTSWHKRNKRSIGTAYHTQNDCASINRLDFDSDDSVADPNFQLISSDEDISNTFFDNQDLRVNNIRRCLFGSNQLDVQDHCSKNINTLENPESSTGTQENVESCRKHIRRKRVEKYCFCYYCKKLVTRIARHLEFVHKNEDEVKRFLSFPKGTMERKLIITRLRKNGDFLYNTNSEYRAGGGLILRRRSRRQYDPSHYAPCGNCKGFYSKLSLWKHYRRCTKGTTAVVPRNVLVESRRIHGLIHHKAGEILKNCVFPVLRNDEVSKVLRYDELAIIYGNRMCAKYGSRLHGMIRSRLRLIGRFLLEIKKIDSSIKSFASVFEPINYENTIKAINVIAKFDETSGKYKAPATAIALATALKFNANILIFECIRSGNHKKKILARDFLKLISQNPELSIYKTANENQLENKCQKKTIPPTVHDKEILNNFPAQGQENENITSQISQEEVDNSDSHRILDESNAKENPVQFIETGSITTEKECDDLNDKELENVTGWRGNAKENPVQCIETESITTEKECDDLTDEELENVTGMIDPTRSIIKRITWTTSEKEMAQKLLDRYINTNKLPSYKECETFISENSSLQNRRPIQLKLWVNNEIRRLKRDKEPHKVDKRISWTTPERLAIEKAFNLHLKEKTLPSIPECIEVKNQYKELDRRNCVVIKAYVNNLIRKNK